MKNSILVKALSLLFLISFPVSGEYKPPYGAENIYDFSSPASFSGGASFLFANPAQGGMLNPSVGGSGQLTALDANYMTAVDLSGEQGWGGHILNIAGSHPTIAGVFSWSARFLYSQMASLDLGIIGLGNLLFSKSLYEDLLVGVGIRGGVGSNDTFDWALTGDLGFLHSPVVEGLNDFRWGAGLRDFGKTFASASGKTAYPSPFTPVIGAGFTPIDTKFLDIGVSMDLSFPYVQNIRLSAAVEVGLFDTVDLRVSSTYDLREIIDPEIELGSFIPNFGLCASFSTESPARNFEAQTSGGPITDNLWGFGLGVNLVLGQEDETPPEIFVSGPDNEIISVGGGGRDQTMSFDLSVEEERYLYGYSFVVEADTGESVYTAGEENPGPLGEGFRGLINRVGFILSNLDIPEQLTWNGRDSSGKPVDDGEYTYYVAAWDDNGNTGKSDKYTVSVDSTPPEINLEPLSSLARIFSPNNDGNKDEVTIEQSGSVEELWNGTISAEGKVYRSFTWANQAPGAFSWNGVTDEGTLANDGVYFYRVWSTDKAGNRSEAVLEDIVLNSEATPISLTINRSFFSPNGDGTLDQVELKAGIPITSGIKDWTVDIADLSGKVVRRFEGFLPVPETIVFDGFDQDGLIVREGEYHASIEVTYINGNNPKSTSPRFTVDLTPPEAGVTSDFSVFSPNGDGNKDIITFYQEASAEETWKGEIYNAAGMAIISYTWRAAADSKVNWDGHGLGGLLAPNGRYSYKIFSVDRAGNSGESNEVFFDLNNESATVFLSREFEAISPNADGVRDAQRLLPQLSITEGIDTFTLQVLNENGDVVRTFAGRGTLDAAYEWGGLADNGVKVPDGVYSARLEISYRNGDRPVVSARPFIIDTVFPVVSSVPSMELFSPNGDGTKDTVTFRNSSGSEDLWEARIVDDGGEIVRRVFWKGRVSSFVWDGSDDEGNIVADGRYFFEIFTTDVGGNYSKARSLGVNLDTRATAIFVSVEPKRFSPNGDGILEDVVFSTLVNEKYGVAAWQLSILKSNGRVVKTFSGDRIPERIIWNGKGEDGTISDGEYTVEFKVEYEMGNRPVARSDRFIIDNTPPELAIRYEPKPFSPDDDGFQDVLEVLVETDDTSDIERWSMTIVDPKGKLFKKFEGKGDPPRRIYWDGKSDNGELVQAATDYPFEFFVVDELGNSAAQIDEIPVDVLVIRDGDRLKIRISNITFEPNSPSLETTDADVMEKNAWVLGRIAGIFRKYATYFIRIEGHAVSVYWANPERAALEQENELVPLSKARAETVKQALVKLGIDPERIQVEGIGGAQPIVPHGDIENRWKNRRVEFILLK